jgi:carboxyl-terminal processing protease
VKVRTVYKIVILPILFLLLCSGASFQLTKRDVRKATENMLNYHVEYKMFSPLLARRALKTYTEQFDSEKIYLLSNEMLPFLEPRDKCLKAIVEGYQKDNFAEFETLNKVIQKAIVRTRNLRKECAEELLTLPEEEQQVSVLAPSVDFAKNETELKERIQKHLAYVLTRERYYSSSSKWSTAQKRKALELWERRFHRAEDSYLFVDASSKAMSEELAEHSLSLHILKAIAKSLDAHTSYYSPEEAHEMRANLEKQFEGIGVILREGVDGVTIVGMIKGGPAERSGNIAVGDMITAIDGKSVTDVPYEEVLRRLQGGEKSHVQLGLRRLEAEDKENSFKVSLTREKILMQEERLRYSSEPFINGIIGKLILPSFYESADGLSCEKDIREALRALKKEGNLLGVVLDLRENSGGFLNQAVKVASLFLSSGVIVISKYARGEVQYLRNLDIHSYFNGPLIILTSKASASAAEIVAQALQDYGIALVVGDERTYGKGTIQYQTVTDTHASCFFKVTVGRYYTVSGRSTQIDGVLGDIFVPTLYNSINIGERYLSFPLKSDRMPSAYIDPLTDVDQRNRVWFQQNYIPNLQKKVSLWTQMTYRLKKNSSYRLETDKDFKVFLKAQEELKAGRSWNPTPSENWGAEDLQMREAVHIIRDMLSIKKTTS